MKIEFSDQLTNLRKEKNLSQEQLAEKLNVTRQIISKWELGTDTPDLNRIEQISICFGVPVEKLLFGKDIDKPSTKKGDGDINNVWEFISKYWWLIFPVGGFLTWMVYVFN